MTKTQIIRRQKLSAWDKLADEAEFSHQPADKRAEDSAQQDDDTPPNNEGYESGKSYMELSTSTIMAPNRWR